MNALVVCRASRLRSAGMVVLFGCQRVGECCRWEADGLRGSARQVRGLVTCLLVHAGWRSWLERMLPEGFLNALGAGGSDALIDRQRLL
jgi:hypothetical protein